MIAIRATGESTMTYEAFLIAVGKQIQKFRKLKFGDASYNSVAHEAKMRGTDWAKIENGKSDFRITTIKKIADALDVTIEQLFICDECKKRKIERIRTKK